MALGKAFFKDGSKSAEAPLRHCSNASDKGKQFTAGRLSEPLEKMEKKKSL